MALKAADTEKAAIGWTKENYGALDDCDPKRHERVTIDTETRMRLNGESEEQMNHAKAISRNRTGGVSLNERDGNDTSKDQDWKYGPANSDTYMLIITIIWQAPKFILLFIPLFIFHIIPVMIMALYRATLPTACQRVRRSCYFYFVFCLAWLFSIPAILLICVSLMYDYIGYYLFSVSYCACTCRWANTWKAMEKIAPYRNGPSIFLKMPDFFIAVLGQTARQSIFETMYMVTMMWMLMPWLKYFINCNPWISDLDHRLCQQISTTMADLGSLEEVTEKSRNIISRATQPLGKAARLDSWSFVPHYPFPPPDRRWALGLQAGGAGYPGKFTLIVHSTHAISNAGGSTEQFVLSNSCAKPIYRVMLWYSNPFHFLTGWVEASASTGMPSQPDKKHGGEHPMWLVTAPTNLISGRDSFTGSGLIDGFFDYWLPVFVHEMRYSHFADKFWKERKYTNVDGTVDFEKCQKEAKTIADDKYQEVTSADGISVPKPTMGLAAYHEEGEEITLDAYAADKRSRSCEDSLAGLTDTCCGKTVREWQQDTDVHGQLQKMTYDPKANKYCPTQD